MRSPAAGAPRYWRATPTRTAVYDGDDWQESVADFVINLVCCRFCRKAPKEIAIPFPTTV